MNSLCGFLYIGAQFEFLTWLHSSNRALNFEPSQKISFSDGYNIIIIFSWPLKLFPGEPANV
jgi:hypothetical protein